MGIKLTSVFVNEQEKALRFYAGTAGTYQQAILKQGIPAASFLVDNVQKEYGQLKKAGVVFKYGPAEAGSATIAIFEDTCGNLIQISQVAGF